MLCDDVIVVVPAVSLYKNQWKRNRDCELFGSRVGDCQLFTALSGPAEAGLHIIPHGNNKHPTPLVM